MAVADLRKSWTRLGVAFDEGFSRKGSIDLERLIVDTCMDGETDKRLLTGVRCWLFKHHDLVNVHRLIKFVKDVKETAILGATIDALLERAPRSSLRHVRKHCVAGGESRIEFEAEEAVADKDVVLRQNRSLALRALFGNSIRSEVLNYLMDHGEGNAHAISLHINQTYQPVHLEMSRCEEIGLLDSMLRGQVRIYRLRRALLRKALRLLFWR